MSRSFLFVGNAESRDLSAFALDADSGQLAPIGTYPVPGPSGVSTTLPLAVSPDKRFLFAALRNQPWSVRSFAIDAASGRLHDIGPGPLADNTCYLSTDRTGRFLFSASYQGNKIAVNPIGADGVVQPPLQVIDTKPKSHSILVDAGNRYALSACLGGDVVYQWAFDADSGRLAPNEPPLVALENHVGARHFIFHPNGRIVYLLTEYAVTIHVYDYDPAQGTLSEKQVLNAMPPQPGGKIWASDIQMTSDGRFLYAAERGSSTIAMCRVSPDDSTLSLTGHIVTEKQPRGFAIDPGGRFLYCTGQLSTRMVSYRIDAATGALARLADYPVGRNPNWVEIVTLP